MDAAAFRCAMRNVAGTVAVIAVGKQKGQRTGLTATSICSLSDDPPALLVCVNRSASAHSRIRADRCFSVNVLAEDQQMLANRFAGREQVAGEARFAIDQWTTLETGAPVLLDAIAVFDCELSSEYQTPTHSIFVGLVRDARVQVAEAPLVYLRGAYAAVRPSPPCG